MKKIYVTGSAGLVGSRLVELMDRKYELLMPEIKELDILRVNDLSTFWKKEKPDAVVHLAAFTDVGEAENQRGDRKGFCWKINVEGTSNLAKICREYGTLLVYVSTDNVFSGSISDRGPYEETHKPEKDENKLTWYGFTKAKGEEKVQEILNGYTSIIRIIYPVRAKFSDKVDYLRKPLQLYREDKLYPLFYDQQISITFIDEACLAIDRIISDKKTGIYHSCSSDTTTPHELVSYFLKKLEGNDIKVKKASLDEFLKQVDNPVRYPKYGGLKVEETEKKLGIKFSSWKEIIDELVKQGIQ